MLPVSELFAQSGARVAETATLAAGGSRIGLPVPAGLVGERVTFLYYSLTARGGIRCGPGVDFLDREVVGGSDGVTNTPIYIRRRLSGSSVSLPITLCSGSAGKTLQVQWSADDQIPNNNTTPKPLFDAGASNCASEFYCYTVVTIGSDDPPPPVVPVVSFATSAQSAGEGAGTRNVAVSVSSGPASAITVGYTLSGTAVRGSDYGISGVTGSTGSVEVSAGATSVSIPVAITDDSGDESDETVVLTLSGGSGYTLGGTSVHTLTITDDDDPPPPVVPVVSFATSAQSAGEGAGTRNVAVSVSSGPASAITVGYTLSGTAVRGSDYGISGVTGSTGSVEVSAGATSVSIPVAITDDSGDEGDETVVLTLSGGSGYTLGGTSVHTLTITDDDDPPPPVVPVVSFATSAQSAGEGAGTRNVAVSVSSGPASAITVGYTLSGTAVRGSDYGISGVTGSTGSVEVSAGATSVSIPVAITDDGGDEGDETVVLTLSGGSGYTLGGTSVHTLTITDDDDPPPPVVPVVSFATSAQSAGEGAGTRNVMVSVSSGPASAITVGYTLSGTAVRGSDYGISGVTGSTGSVEVSAGATSVSIPVAITDDGGDEGDETVVLTLSGGSGYTLGGTSVHTLTITDDDGNDDTDTDTDDGSSSDDDNDDDDPVTPAPPSVSLSVAPNPVTEGQSLTVTATLSRTLSSPVVVPLTLSAGTAEIEDYEAPASVTVPAGRRSGADTIATAQDNDTEDETFTVALGVLPDTVTRGTPASASVTIRDNDKARAVSVKNAMGQEGEPLAFTVRIEPAAGPALTLNWRATDGTARIGADYAMQSFGSVTIPADAGTASFAVMSMDDRIDEDDETFTVTLSGTLPAGTRFVEGGDTATAMIRDNDEAGIALSVATLGIGRPGRAAHYTVRLLSEPEAPVTVTVSSDAADVVTVSPGSLTFTAADWEAARTLTLSSTGDGEASITHRTSSSDGDYAALTKTLRVRVDDDLVSTAAAWLARFVRTHVGHVLDGIAARIGASSAPGLLASLAGVGFEPFAPAGGGGTVTLERTPPHTEVESLRRTIETDARGDDEVASNLHAVSGRDALVGTAFAMSGEKTSSGALWSVWGRGASSRFDGKEGALSLDGDVATGTLGLDREQGPWRVGLALSYSAGEGTYRRASGSPGDLESTLGMVTPWASGQVTDRITAWAALGYGEGTLRIEPEGRGALEADTETSMAAAGARGALIEMPAEGGLGLALTSDALWLRATSEKVGTELDATSSDVSRLRLGVEGSWRRGFEGLGTLDTRLEVGARHDGGDAETGFGVDLGGGTAWADLSRGLDLSVEGRGLLAHDASGFRDLGVSAAFAWDANPASPRGASLMLRQDWGGMSSGGLDRLLSPAGVQRPGDTDKDLSLRFSAEAAYGFSVMDGRFTGSPYLGYRLSGTARDYRLGWRLNASGPFASGLSFGIGALRRESDGTEPAHSAGFELATSW